MIVHKVGVPMASTSLQLLHIFYPSVFWLGHLLAIPTATSASQQSPWHPKPKRLVSHATLYAPSIKQVSLNSTCPLLLPFKTPPPPPPLHHTLSLSLSLSRSQHCGLISLCSSQTQPPWPSTSSAQASCRKRGLQLHKFWLWSPSSPSVASSWSSPASL